MLHTYTCVCTTPASLSGTFPEDVVNRCLEAGAPGAERVYIYALQYLMASLDVSSDIVQELCGNRGGRPGLSVLTSLLASVDVKIY